MKKNLKLDLKNIFKAFYILIVILSLTGMYFLALFLYEQVYRAMVLDPLLLETQVSRAMGDINVEKFDKIIAEIEKKSYH